MNKKDKYLGIFFFFYIVGGFLLIYVHMCVCVCVCMYVCVCVCIYMYVCVSRNYLLSVPELWQIFSLSDTASNLEQQDTGKGQHPRSPDLGVVFRILSSLSIS